jgi:hypothetical protein
MLQRSLAGIIIIIVGAFAIYTVIAKPQPPYSEEPVEQAIGIPKIVTRVIRGVLGLCFVTLGIVVILKAFRLIS